MSAAPAAVEESVRSMIEAWGLMVGRVPGARVERYDGGTATWGDVAMPFFNMCFVDAPATDDGELRRRLDAAVGYAADKGQPWFAVVCEEWLPAAPPSWFARAK